MSGSPSAKVTRLGVWGGARTGSASGGGESANGAVQAGRRACASQDLGAVVETAVQQVVEGGQGEETACVAVEKGLERA
eukprot:490495-Amphidinium_carterae.1